MNTKQGPNISVRSGTEKSLNFSTTNQLIERENAPNKRIQLATTQTTLLPLISQPRSTASRVPDPPMRAPHEGAVTSRDDTETIRRQGRQEG